MDNIQYPVTGSSGWGTKINNNFKNISDTIGSINKDSDGDIGTQLNDCAKKDGSLQTGLNAEKLNGKISTDFYQKYENLEGKLSDYITNKSNSNISFGLVYGNGANLELPQDDWGFIVEFINIERDVYTLIAHKSTFGKIYIRDFTVSTKAWHSDWNELLSATEIRTMLEAYQLKTITE